MRSSTLLAASAVVLAAPSVVAQAVPSPRDVLGFELGLRFTTPTEVVEYAEALAEASASARVVRYGETFEGRPLILLVLASEDNMNRLEAILDANARLLDPDLPEAEASRIARANPAIAWLSYGVHGDETSSTEAALWTAWDLATSSGELRGVLDSLVVVIDPVANPDGRARYVEGFRSVAGATPNPAPVSREHSQTWPGGRYNHFMFDLNRDWTWATQAETRARLQEWARWNPQVHIDFHEMGYNSTYFFFPAAEPLNPIYPDYTVRWAEYFGRANADAFDSRRWLYYTGETFDMFYPGFGDTWPSLVGAIGMTYEQAGGGRAGLAVRRSDGTILTLADRAMHHRVAGLATVRSAAMRKTDLLSEFAGFHRTQGDGQPDILLVPGPDHGRMLALVDGLQTQGIRVERATRAFRAAARPHPGHAQREDFPIGTLRVPARQARGRLATTLLQPETTLDPDVGQTYDIKAWSLPYAFGVEAHSVEPGAPGGFERLPRPGATAEEDVSGEGVPYGWLVAPSFTAAGPLFRFLKNGGRATALPRGFELSGESWPPGTVFLPGGPDVSDVLRTSGLVALARAVDSGRTAGGPDLGTGSGITLTAPRIAVAAGEGFWPTSVGSVWYLLESWAGLDVDLLESASLSGQELAAYDVLVLPAGNGGRTFGDAASGISEWVRDGGTLVTLGGASRWAATELAEVTVRTLEKEDMPDEVRLQRGLRTLSERRSDAWDEAVQGIILPLTVDFDHPLAWGLGRGSESGSVFTLHLDDLAFEPAPDLETVAAFGPDVQAISGLVSQKKVDELASSSWLAVKRLGRGKVIMFADDILFRLMWYDSFVVFTNALLLGPAMR